MPLHLNRKTSDQVVMTIEKGERPTSPVHVHVDDKTPVHVHVKKPKKPVSIAVAKVEAKMAESKSRIVCDQGDSNLRRSAATATAKSRSKSPARTGPWVPPPAKTTKATKYSWQGPSHRLEISAPQDAEAIQSTLRMSDLDTDEEDQVTNKMRGYEKKIDSLMSEVGGLKSQVELQRTRQEMEKKNDLLERSRHILDEQELEIGAYQRELEATDHENRLLRHSMDRYHDDTDINKGDRAEIERESLMKKLVEVEMDGQAAAKQAAALRDACRRLKEEKRLSQTDASVLAKQKELLLERLSDFESANRALRRMLRDRHEQEACSMRLTEQRDVLLKKLSEADDGIQRYRHEALDKERQLADFRLQIEAQKEENLAMGGLQTSLESTRGHLQKQLRQKEADCNRMAVQIRSLESQLAQERIDVDHLRELLGTAKEKADRDKEALKKATRVQKQRAEKSQDAVEHTNIQLLERDTMLAEVHTEMDGMRARADKLAKEKSQAIAETSALKMRVSELESIMERLEDDSKLKVETATARLHEKTSESATFRLESERLKTSLATIEDKLSQGEAEISQLRSSLRQYETLVDEYRSQMNRSRREADDTMVQLEDQRRETTRVKSRLQTRLEELEPIPELLKSTELKLQDKTEHLLSSERRNTENTKLIAELIAKVEQLNCQSDQTRERLHTTQDSNLSLQTKLDALDRKLTDIETQNRELLTTVAKREEAIHQSNMRMEEVARENASLQRQLETALMDSRRQAEQSREKSSSKDRAVQSRLLDLESQLSQARAEVARVKREKEESERKFNSRLYDIKDRLEQSHSTNRSMQNYVQFLKNSYANVFGDSSMATTSSPIRSNFH